MDMNKTAITDLQPNIPFSLQEQPHSGNLAREDTGKASVFFKRNNYSIHIYLFYIVMIISTIIIIVSAVYIANSTTITIPVNKADYGPANYKNESETMLDCILLSPLSKDWYYQARYNPGYACEPFKIVTTINIQPLCVRGHECNDIDHCFDVIHTYMGIMEEHSKFGFYVDNNANVYGGRGWFCEYLKGQIWVAVMVDGFGAASQAEKDRILHNFEEGVIPYTKYCSVNVSDLQFNYFDGIIT